MSQKHDLPSTIILPTSLAIKLFESTTMAMSNVDYDLDEIITLIIGVAIDANKQEEKLDHLTDLCLMHGAVNGEPSDDGRILAHGVHELASRILEMISNCNLYTVDGKMPYLYKKLIHRDLVLELSPHYSSSPLKITFEEADTSSIRKFMEDWIARVKDTDVSKIYPSSMTVKNYSGSDMVYDPLPKEMVIEYNKPLNHTKE